MPKVLKDYVYLIKRLDVKQISTNGGRIHVYYLNYGDAQQLAKTLSTIISTSNTKSSSKRRLLRSFSSSLSGENSLFTSEVKITADTTNNALVVTASPTDYLTIKQVIKKLDIPKDQVYVEGLIMETQISKAKGYGVSYLGVYGEGNARRYGFSGGKGDLINLLTNKITKLGGLFVGAGSGKVLEFDPGDGNVVKVNSLNALITAIVSNSNTNVLATPQVMALDNQESLFEAGESIPIPKQTTAANGSTTISVEQQKIGLKLKITPNINKVTRFIKLKIHQTIQDFSGRSLPEGLAAQGVATTERSARTTVVVRDRDTIAMGGLMRDRIQETVSKVPLLGDIPLLGWLFRNKTQTVEKVNLLFFLTPRILASYQNDNADNVQDLLNRREHHFKHSRSKEDDPFSETAQGLYHKAQQQKVGPLYDQSASSQYRRSNEQKEGIKATEEIEDFQDDLRDNDEIENIESGSIETPNYKKILQARNAIKGE